MKDDDNATIQVSSHGKWWCQNNIQILEGQVERLQERVNALQMTAEEGREIYGERFHALETGPRHAHHGKCSTELCGWPIDPRRVTEVEDRLDALERATPAREEFGEDCAIGCVKHTTCILPRLERAERERDDLKDALDELCGPDVTSRHDAREYLLHSVSATVKRARNECDAARASAEKLQGLVNECAQYGHRLPPELQAALDQAGDLAHTPSGDRA